MAIKIFHDYEIGKGLAFADNQVNVKPDNSGNVQFEVTEDGIKGVAPEFDATNLETSINNLEERLNQHISLNFADHDEIGERLEELENREDIKLAGAEIDGTNLKLTTSDNVEIVVDLVKFVDAIPTAEEIYAEIKQQILDDVKADLKGEEIQDFAGVTKGYLIQA